MSTATTESTAAKVIKIILKVLCLILIFGTTAFFLWRVFSSGNPKSLERIKEITGKDFRFYEVDLCDKAALEKVFVENPDIDSAIHFAGLKAVGESVQMPGMYYYNNLVSTLNLIDLMSKYDAKHIVFSSSATVYGMPKTVPLSGDFPLSTDDRAHFEGYLGFR